MKKKTQFEKGHDALEGAGRPKGAVTQCKEIRSKRRENALMYVLEQQERLKALEDAILTDVELKSSERYRLMVEIERIRQQEVTLSVPSEQSLSIDDGSEAKSSRALLMAKMEEMKAS